MTATADPAAESAEGPAAGPAAGSAGPAKIRLTDSTLGDGSHAMAHRFTEEQVRGVVHGLDSAGVEVIEVTHGDGLGGSSFNYGCRSCHGRATWARPRSGGAECLGDVGVTALAGDEAAARCTTATPVPAVARACKRC